MAEEARMRALGRSQLSDERKAQLRAAYESQRPEPDLSEPSDERKAELRAAYQEGSDTPYKGARIGALGELTWICAERGWSGAIRLPDGMTRPNLSGADLSQTSLSGANLYGARLSGADFTLATLSAVDLREARLDGADLRGARLNGADLRGARLSGADLTFATLSGVDLRRALLNAETRLDGVTFAQPPTVLGVRWNGAPLDEVEWGQIQRLGDEPAIGAIEAQATQTERTQSYRDAARAYHGLVVALEAQGLTEPARRFRRRERVMQQRERRTNPRSWPAYAFYALLNLLSGQGEAPERVLAAYLVVVGAFTGMYLFVSNAYATGSPPLKWYEALVLSLSSFHGRGFFASQIGLGNPLAIIAAVEAVVGLFIELILIATFTNRFLNS